MSHVHGKPCRKCSATLRFARDGGCVTCARAYDRARNQRMSDEERQRRREYNAAYRADPARRVEAAERTRAWVVANPERAAEWRKAYRAENKPKIYAWIHGRRATKRNAPGKHTAADVLAIGERQKWRCAWCRLPCRNAYHVDHIVPLARGGSNWPDNLCIACPTCNMRKKDKLPHEFTQSLGMLL